MQPDPQKSTAENILMMLREDRQYTELEARILDMALVLHMDHMVVEITLHLLPTLSLRPEQTPILQFLLQWHR